MAAAFGSSLVLIFCDITSKKMTNDVELSSNAVSTVVTLHHLRLAFLATLHLEYRVDLVPSS